MANPLMILLIVSLIMAGCLTNHELGVDENEGHDDPPPDDQSIDLVQNDTTGTMSNWSITHKDFVLNGTFGLWLELTFVRNSTCQIDVSGSTDIGGEPIYWMDVYRAYHENGDLKAISGTTVDRGFGFQSDSIGVDEIFPTVPRRIPYTIEDSLEYSANESISWIFFSTRLDEPENNLEFHFSCNGGFTTPQLNVTNEFEGLMPGSFEEGTGFSTPEYSLSEQEKSRFEVQGSGSVFALVTGGQEQTGTLHVQVPDGQNDTWAINKTHDDYESLSRWWFHSKGESGLYTVELNYESYGGSIHLIIADWEKYDV